jgi:hypothetical protein
MSAPAGTAVGLSVPQLEGDDKLCGSAQYIADLHRPACCTARSCRARMPMPASAATT